MSTLRKILTTGVGAALMTESGIRSALSDNKITQQAVDYLTKQLVKGKEEVVNLVVGEFKKFLSQIDIQKEFRKALEGLDIEIQAFIRINSDEMGTEETRFSFRTSNQTSNLKSAKKPLTKKIVSKK